MRQRRGALTLVAAALLAAGCGGGSDDDARPGRLIVRTALVGGPIRIEGTVTQVRIRGEGVSDESRRQRLGLAYDRPLPAGGYDVVVDQLGCNGYCDNLDPPDPTLRCTFRAEVRPGEATRLFVRLEHVGVDGPGRARCFDRPLTRDAYQADLLRLRATTGGLGRLYSRLVTARPRRDCRRAMRGFYRRLMRFYEEVAALRAPADAQPVQDRLTAAGLDGFRALVDVGIAVDNGDLPCGERVNDRLNGLPAMERVDAALAELEELGYRLGLE